MTPYHLIHLALPILHLEPHKKIVLHLSSPLSSCRYYPARLPESNLRHQAPSHAPVLVNPRRQGSLHADAVLNHIPTSTTTASSLAPRIHSTVAMNKSNTPTRASGLFQRFQVFKDSKRASVSSKTSQTFRAKGLSGPHPFKFSGGLRDYELHNGHLAFEG